MKVHSRVDNEELKFTQEAEGEAKTGGELCRGDKREIERRGARTMSDGARVPDSLAFLLPRRLSRKAPERERGTQN